jgi:hypothetical protein
MSYDFNNADKQTDMEIIPAGTIVPLVMTIRPGGQGEGGWLTASKNSDAQMLDCEFTVAEGPYARRKVWQYLVLSGGKLNDKGESIAAGISRSMLRAVLESARNVDPNDMSDAAVSKRRAEWKDFCSLTFLAKLGVDKDKTGQYGDKNRIQSVITPNMKDYVNQGGSGSAPAQPVATAPWSSGQSATAQPSSPPWGTSAPAPESPNPVPAWAR